MQRKFRLRRSEDFARLREQGATWANSYAVLSAAPNHLPHNRYGIITTKKLGVAVARNRAKRRLREAIRHLHPTLKPGHDVVFIVRRRVLTGDYEDLLEAVRSLLRRADLLYDGGGE